MYFGSIIGGPDVPRNCALLAAFDRAANIARPLVPEEGTTGLINVVLHVPGSIVKPDHHGLRTAKFSRKRKLLMIQISVPPETLHSEQAPRIVLQWLREAVLMAEPKFRKIGIPYSVDDNLAVIARIEQSCL